MNPNGAAFVSINAQLHTLNVEHLYFIYSEVMTPGQEALSFKRPAGQSIRQLITGSQI